jgi:hypothetical protein
MASGGFAGGLAEGLNNTMGLYMQNMYYGGRIHNQEEANRIREEAAQAKTAKSDSGGGSNKGGDYEGFDASLVPIFKAGNVPTNAAPQSQPVMANPAGLAGSAASPASPTTLPDAGLIASNPPAAYQGGSLAAPAQAPSPAQAAPASDEQINPRQEIVKQMMFGNLANEPDKLNAIAAAAAMHGLGDKITPWLQSIYKAKKSGILDGAMNLINNNVDGAIDDLKRGGINLADRPTKVEPDNPNDHRWNINVEGTGQRVMDVRNMVATTMDPDKFMELQNKTKVANAQADAHTANAEESRAKAALYTKGGLTAASRGVGGGGNGSTAKAASVRKVMETDKGILAIMSDGSKRVITGDDGKPSFGTSNLKIAAGLVGKTLDPLGDNNNIADRVNTVAGQLGGGSKPAPAKLKDLPEGAKMIGTSKGKPVYEVNGKKFIPE